MGHIEKTVFISYRRTNMPWALAIYQNLTAHGYDVFFDYESIASGDFEQVILGNIRARAHFLVILTPSALERCNEPGDWLRREIETALDEKRNIVPLFLEGFSFSSQAITQQLAGKLIQLKSYNGLNIPIDYFNEALERLTNRYLNISLDTILHPVSERIQKEVKKQQAAAGGANAVIKKDLNAQELYEQARKHWLDKKLDDVIHFTTEAIRQNPDFAEAYCGRGAARGEKGDLEGAIKDFTEAIRLKPNYAEAYDNRGNARRRKGDLDGAIKDFTESIRLKRDYASVYWNRGVSWEGKGDYYSAAADYQKYFDAGGKNEKVRQLLKNAKAKLGK